VVWIGFLVAANFAGSLLFIHTLEGQVVLAAAMVGVIIQLTIFSTEGFVRLLVIGHVVWIPMIPWLWSRYVHLPSMETDSFFAFWLITVMVVDGLSLIIDMANVVRYIHGEHKIPVKLNKTSEKRT
jgi:hypothetical protein